MRSSLLRPSRKLSQRAARRQSLFSRSTDFGRLRRRVILAGSILGLFAGVKTTAMAAGTEWTNANSDQLWSIPLNWTAGAPNATSDVLFPGAVPVGGAISLLNAATSNYANSLTFLNSYTLDTNPATPGTATLTLGGASGMGTISVAQGSLSTIKVALVDDTTPGAPRMSLLKTGLGSLTLTNSLNTFSGEVIINDGSLVVTDVAQLGTGLGPISVNGIAGTGNPGFSGGQLVVQGGFSGINFTRDLSLNGRGPNPANASGALVSIGNNTFGDILISGTSTETRVLSTVGTTTIGGTLTLGSGQGSVFYGNGNWYVSGQVTGFDNAIDRLIKTGSLVSSTLTLANSSNSFLQNIRIDSGTVRVSTGLALGQSTQNAALDMNGGTLEIRTDDGTTFGNRNVNQRANSAIFVSRAVDGSGLNELVTLGKYTVQSSNTSLTFNGRDGYSVKIGDGNTMAIATGNPWTLTNNLNGTLTLNNTLSFNDGTGRVMTINGSGDTVLTGNILTSGTANHVWTKAGTGTLTIQGTAGTFTGSLNVTGTAAVTDFGAFSSTTATGSNAVQLNSGAIDYRGTGQTTTKLISLTGTTGNGIILANQPSGTGLVIGGNPIAAAGAGSKNFILGGTSAPDVINQIGGVITNNSATNITGLTKVGGNTWLYSPDASTYHAAPSTLVTGTAASSTNSNLIVLAAGSDTSGLFVGQVVTGSNVPGGSVITGIDGLNIRISNNISTAVAAGVTLTFGGAANFTGNVTIAGGTMQVRPSAASGNGSDVINNSSQIVFNLDALAGLGWAGGTFEYQGSTATGALTESVGALNLTAGAGIVKTTANGGTPTLSFASYSARTAGATVNFQQGAGTGIQFAGAPTAALNGVLSGAYITDPVTGAIDFVATPAINTNVAALGSTTALPTDAGSATANYLSTGDLTTKSAVAANTVRLAGAQTLTLGGNLTLTNTSATQLGGILFDNSTGAATINGGNIAGSVAANELLFITGGSNAANALTINSTIGAGAASAFTKAGTGKLILSGANTFSGNVNINEGSVQLVGPTAALGSPVAATVANLRQNTTLDLNGAGAGGVITLGALNGAGRITNSGGGTGGASTLAIGTTATTGVGVFSGLITDGAGLINVTKTGTSASTQALTGLNTYTGITTIAGGSTLIATTLANGGSASSIGASSSAAGNLVFNNGVLQYTGATATIYQTTGTPSVSINRLFTLAGSGTLDSSGTYGNSVLAAGVANHAALVFNNPGAIAFGSTGAKTLTLTGTSTGDNELAARLGDNTDATKLSVTKTGAGTWILSNAANDYSGPTTITQGALRVQGNSLSPNSTLTFNGSGTNNTVLETSGLFTRAIGTGPGQVTWNTNLNGGFAASSSRLTVNFGGAGAGVSWGTGGIGNGTGILILGSATAMNEVEIVNPIDLNGANRTVQVDTSTFTSTAQTQATLSGVLSGVGGGLIKSGGGALILSGANTYTGNTSLTNGSLFVSSLGNSNGTTSSSLGASGGTLILGSGTNTVQLLYVGAGESSDRPISFGGAAATMRLDNSGSGALVLSNITNNATGATVLELRGTNTDVNTISAQLKNSGSFALSISKADGGVWLLNPSVANTFTGNIGANGGTLLLTQNGIGAAASLSLSNGALAAYGGPLTIGVPVTLSNNATAVFSGANSITINSTVTKAAGANDQTFSNNLDEGAVLTINGNFMNLESASSTTRTISFRGYGDTTWNGVIQNHATASNLIKFDIRQANNAVFTLTGDSPNTNTGGYLLGQGTLVLGKVGALGGAAGAFTFDGGVLQAGLDLTGTSKIVNPVTVAGDPATITGTNSIEFGGLLTNSGGNRLLINNLSGGATLTLSATNAISLTNDTAARTLNMLGSGNTLVSGIVQNGGTGAGGLNYLGTGSLTLTAANTATGTLTASSGLVTLGGASGAWTTGATSVPAGATLRLDNGTTNNNNRLGDTLGMTLSGGTLDIVGNGTTETTGALNANTVTSKITMSGSGAALTFASVTLTNSGGSLDLSAIPNLGTTNKVLFTNSSGLGLVNSIAPKIFVGSDFATYDAAKGVIAYSAYNNANNLDSAAATETLNATADLSSLSARTINALKINGSGLTIGATGRALTLGTGGLINTGGNNTLTGPIGLGNVGVFQIANGTTLDVTGSVISAQAFLKAGSGTLKFSAPQYFNSTMNLLDGTMVLNGGLNTIIPANQVLNLNPGATLDLNGNAQYIGQIATTYTVPGTALANPGTITSSTGAGTFVTNMAASTTFGGQITGANVNFVRVGGNTLTLETAQPYGGKTVLMGGTTTLQDDATLLNTTSIDLNYATLFLGNNSGLQMANTNRLSDTAPITMRGGTLQFTGRVDDAASETVGAITTTQGANTITVSTGGTGTAGAFTSADFTITSLTRQAGTTVNFTTSSGTLGTLGNNVRVNFGTPLATTGAGLLGPWAIANSTDYAGYNSVNGVGVIGSGGFAPYDLNFAPGNLTNVGSDSLVATSKTLPSGGATTGVLKMGGAVSNDLLFTNDTDVLNLQFGGLLRSANNNTTNLGSASVRGVLTAGGNETRGTRELVVYNASNATGATVFTINSVIADNGQGNSVRFVKSGAGVLSLTAPNTYTGGTVVNQGTLELRGSVVTIPAGGLTLSGGIVTMFANEGQIAATNDVTLNDSSTLTLVGDNTLKSLTFNNVGGTGTPTVSPVGTLTLTSAAPVTVTTNNAATTPVINGGTLALSAGAKTFDIGAISAAGQQYTDIHPSLNITSAITGAGTSINKIGGGLLQLSGASTFDGGVNLQAGGLILGANSTPSGAGSAVASGPLGTGALTVATGAQLLLDNASRSIGNDITFAGTPSFGNTAAGTAVTMGLNGVITFNSNTPTLSIDNPFLTVALGAPLKAGITSITKNGYGALALNVDGYLGSININGNNAVSLMADGDGTGQTETIATGAVNFETGVVGSITVGRNTGASLPLNQASNKTIAPASISGLANGLSVTNNNGYGLLIGQDVTLNSGALFTVSTGSNSGLVQGLTIGGKLSGAGFTKASPGALVLANSANDFVGNVTVNGGVISISNDGQLGDSGNVVVLAPTSGQTATLRATDNITTSRVIKLGTTTDNRSIEVSTGKTLTLNSAFDVSSAGAANLLKIDNGTLVLNAVNSNSWTGAVTINAGAVQVTNDKGLGNAIVNVASVLGSALQLSGGVTIANTVNLSPTANVTNGGINFGGALQSVSGVNTVTGPLTVNFDGSIGADAGATLNVNGGITNGTGTSNRQLWLSSEGTINIGTTPLTGLFYAVQKMGAGTTTLSVPITTSISNTTGLVVNAGTFVLNGTAKLTFTGTTPTLVNDGATLTVDDTSSAIANRLGGKSITMAGGTLNYIANGSAASSEALGAAAAVFNAGLSTINLTNAGASAATLTIGSAAPTLNGGSTLNFTGSFGTTTNKILFGAAPALSNGLLARGTVNGNEFAAYGSNGITAFTGYSAQTDISSAATTDTFKATSLTTNTVPSSQTLNALTLNATPTGGFTVDAVTGLTPTTLTLSSGAILATGGGTAGIEVPVVALGGVEGVLHVSAGTTLNVDSGFTGTAGLSKSLTGTVNLNAPQFYTGTTYVNSGTMNLAPHATNTLLYNNGLVVNIGGTLDLKGGSQFVSTLSSQGSGVNTGVYGGTVTSTGGAATLVASGGSANFGGQITGPINLVKANTGGTFTLTSDNPYTGSTISTGGVLVLADNGALSQSSSLTLNYSTLQLDNNRLTNNNDRLRDGMAVTLNGGALSLFGRAGTFSSEKVGAVTANSGTSTITAANSSNSQINEGATLTLASFTRNAANAATVNFGQNFSGTSSGFIGQIADGQTTGRSENILVTGGIPVTNNIIGGWGVVSYYFNYTSAEFASYTPQYGVGALGINGMPGYDGTALPAVNQPTQNIRLGTSATTTYNVPAGGLTLNSLNIADTGTAAAVVLNFANATDTLNLTSGGFLVSNTANATSTSTVTLGSAQNNGRITAGGLNPSGRSDLYLYYQAFTTTTNALTVNAAIVDNPNGQPVRFVPFGGTWGASTITLASNQNSYTGGTVINGETLQIGATGNLPAGGVTLNGGTLSQVAGGVLAAQDVTINGGNVMLANQANTLANLTFNNLGGSTPTVTPTGTLTLTGKITASSANAGAISTIGTGNLDLNGNNSFAVTVNPALANGVDIAPWQSALTINSVVQNGGMVKDGAGNLQLGGQSTFAGGVKVNAGGLILAASSTPSGTGQGALISGPLGTGTLTMAANTSLLASTAVTLLNDVVFQGDTFFTGTSNITFNGLSTIPAIWNATVSAPQTTITLADISGSLATDVINKSGLGTLIVGNYNGTLQAAGGLLFSDDGNGLGSPESISLGGGVQITGNTSLTVNHSAAALTALNKTLQKTTLDIGANTIALTNTSGYGLEFTGTTTLSGVPTISVANATNSNVVQGLTLSGKVTGPYGIVKSGLGTLALTNATNDFGGVGQVIDIRRGVLSVSNDGALGNAANGVLLNVNATTAAGFRATGTFSSAREFTLNQANNAFEVTQGNVLTLTTPFTLASASNALTKNDNGVLAIAAANPTWTGAITINSGAIRAMNDTALGTGAVTIINQFGSGLQLAGDITLANNITINTSGASGFDNRGAVESFSGNNTVTGLITNLSGVSMILGANEGATLNIVGGTSSPGSNSVAFSGAGDINITTKPIGNGANGGNNFQKLGSGTLNIAVASPAYTGSTVIVSAGTMKFSGAGSLGTNSTGAVTLDVGGTLTLDNSGTAVNNRLATTRNITLRGGNLNLIGNDTTSVTETFAAPSLSRGQTTITLTAGTGAQTNLLFTGSSTVPTNAQNNGTAPTGVSLYIRGTNLGLAAGNGVATIKNTGSTNGFAFNGQNGATGAKTKGIMPYAIVENTTTGVISFATGDSGGTTNAGTIAILRPLNTTTEMDTDVITANNNIRLTKSVTLAAGVTAPNSLTLETGGALALNAYVPINLSSGGILAKVGNAGISGGAINQTSGFSPLNVWTVGDLTIGSVLNGGNGIGNGNIGFVKAGAGMLTLSTPTSQIPGFAGMGANSYSGQLVLNQGTIKLDGGLNTIQPNNYLAIDGGTLDLNGNSQFVGGLFTDGAVTGAGGTITNSDLTNAALFVNNADNSARNFAGSITGNLSYNRAGQNTLTFYSPQTYSGKTILTGGTTSLRDTAALVNTSAIEISFAQLTLDNAGTADLTDRVNDTAPVLLRGGNIQFNGRSQTASSETLGALTIDDGYSQILLTAGGTNINSLDATFASLAHAAGSTGTIRFQGGNAQIGSAPRILFTSAPTLTNNIIAPWAVQDREWATYVPGLGVAQLIAPGAAGYATTNVNNAFATDNVRVTAAATMAADRTVNTLAVISGGTINLNLGGNTLTTVAGGIILGESGDNQNLTLSNGNVTAGTGSPIDLYFHVMPYGGTNRTANASVNFVDNGATGAVRLIKAGDGNVVMSGLNTYTGGTVVNSGILTLSGSGQTIPSATDPTRGLVINNGAAVTMTGAAGQLGSTNIVTINGGGTLNLIGDNTIKGIVFNNLGGTANPTVNSYSVVSNAGSLANGVLTIGDGGVTASSSNVGTTNLLSGRVDFGTTAKTVTVNPITVNGVEIAPLQAALALQGVINSTGGIIKEGDGVLQFNAQEVFTGKVTVNHGSVQLGVANSGSRFSELNLNGANTRFNLNNQTTTIGSLSGNGIVFSSFGAPTLTVGYDNSDTTFSGQLMRFNDGALNGVQLTKIGSGTLNMTSAQSFATGTNGTINVSGGTLQYSDAGRAFPGTSVFAATIAVNSGGILRLDNTGTNLNNRLGMNVAGTLTVQGGEAILTGNSAVDTAEQITTFTPNNGFGFVTLQPNANSQLGLTITTLSGENGSGSAVFRGLSTEAGPGLATLTITNPSFITGQANGAAGSTNMSIRTDLLGDASATGLGTGYLVKDSVSGFWRAMTANELQMDPLLWATQQNAGLSSDVSFGSTRIVNSLTASGTGSFSSALPDSYGIYGTNAGLLSLQTDRATFLGLDGSVTNINTPVNSASTGTTYIMHAVGNAVLNMNSYFGTNSTGGIDKTGDGTINFNGQALYSGTTSVGAGRLNLNSGADNTLFVNPGASTPTVSALQLNTVGATVDLKNHNQAIGSLSAINATPGTGGTVTNSGPDIVTLTSNGGGTFSGHLTGNLGFTRTGNNTTLFTSSNDYAGPTVVRGGTLQLRDAGSILNTSSITLNYGTLLLDNFGLSALNDLSPTRVSATTPIFLQGGAVTLNGGGSMDSVATLGTITATGGQNTINVLPFINEGSTATVNIANLQRDVSSHSFVNFNGYSTNNSSGTSSTAGQGYGANGHIFLGQVNGANFAAANLTNKLIGGWAVADGNTFATYIDGYGVAILGQNTQGVVAPGFDGSDVSAATTTTQNISDGTTARTITGAHTANSWRMSQSTGTQTITLAANTPVTLNVGIITNSNQTTTIAGTDATSTLAGTGSDFYVYVNQSVTTNFNVKFTGGSSIIKGGGGTLALAPAGASNDYTGGTFVNGGTLSLNAAAGRIAVPGDLEVNNATVTMNTNAQQIAATSHVTLNGGSVLNLTGTNTLAGLVMNELGGTGNATANVSTLLTLTDADAITVNNDSFSNTPTIAGTALALSNAAPVIKTTGLSPNNLVISAPITSAGGPISKAGAGSVVFSGANTFTTGVNLNEGSIILGLSSTPTTGTVTNGPLGTGTLTVGINGGTLLADGTARTVANPVALNGDLTFGGLLAGNNVTLSGPVNLGSANRTLTVSSPAVTATISGAITSTSADTAFTKAGAGILLLSSGSNNFGTAGVAVTGGILRNGVANAIPAGTAMNISAGAGYDLANFSTIVSKLTGTGFVTNTGAAPQSLTVGGTSGSDTTSNFDMTFSGSLTNSATTNALSLVKVGAGTLTLDGVSSYTGNTILNSGTIRFGVDGALGASGAVVINGGTLQAIADISNARNLTLNATMANIAVDTGTRYATAGLVSGTGGLNKIGGGTLALLGMNNYAGPTIINSGTLAAGSVGLGGAGNFSSIGSSDPAAANFVINDGATFRYEGFGDLTDRLFTVGAGATGATIDGSGTGPIYFIGLGDIALGGLATDSHTLRLTGTTDPVLENVLSSHLTGNLSLVKSGGNTWTLTADNDYTGGTVVEAGTLQLGQGTTTGMILNTVGAMVTVNTGATLAFNHSDDVNFRATISGNGAVMNVGTGSLTLSGANTYVGETVVGNGSELTVTTNGALGSDTAGTVIQNGGALRLGVNYTMDEALTLIGAGNAGEGALTLASGTSSASYSGPIIVGPGGATISPTTDVAAATGTLMLNGDITKDHSVLTFKGDGTVVVNGVIGGGDRVNDPIGNSDLDVDATRLVVNQPATYFGPTRVINGGSIVSGVDNALPADTTVTLGAGGATLDLNGNAQALAGLSDTGTGTHVVTNSGGDTGVKTGTLNLTANSTFGGTIQDGAAKTAVAVTGTGTKLIYTGTNTYTGGTTIGTGATVQVGDGGTTGTLSGDVTNNGTLAYKRTDTVTVSGAISGSGSLVQAGTGRVILDGADTYAGDTTVLSGALEPHGSLVGNVAVSSGATFDVSHLVGGANYAVPATKTLSNDGTVVGSLDVSGTVNGNGTITGALNALTGGLIAPGGNSQLGVLNVTGALTLGAGSMIGLDLGGVNAGTSLADLLVASAINLSTTGSGVTLSLGFANGYQMEGNGTLFFVMSNTGLDPISGTFANATTPLTMDGQTYNVLSMPTGGDASQFAISYDANIATGAFHGGNDIALMAVPEPSSAVSLLLGAASLLGARRFRRRKA